MRTHNELVSLFNQIADDHKQIKSFGYGDLGEVIEKDGFSKFEYPRLFLIDQPNLVNGFDYFHNFRFLIMDIPAQDESDETEIISDTKSIVIDVIALLKDIDNSNADMKEFMLQDSINIDPFTERFGDMVAGWSATVSYKEHFGYHRCEVPFEGTIVLNGGCAGVVVTDSDGVTETVVASGGNFTCTPAGGDATVENSDLTYTDTVAPGATLVLPDINHIDSDGSVVPTPAQTVFTATPCTTASGIAYQMPMLTGQLTSYRANDDGGNLAAGTYDYTPPPFPVSYARLDTADANAFFKLISNNTFGHKFRLTGTLGGYRNPVDGVFYDVNGVVSSKAIEFADGLVIDHLTRLMWILAIQTGIWNDLISNAATTVVGGFTGFHLGNLEEVKTVADAEDANWFNYQPFKFSITPLGNLFTSTTRKQATTQAFTFQPNGNGLGQIAKTNNVAGLYCRYHL